MKNHLNSFLATAWALLLPIFICAQKAPYSGRFEGIKSVEFNIYHGNLTIIRHASEAVEITGISQNPEQAPVTKISGEKLMFSENSTVDGSSPDWPVWTMKVPQNIDLDLEISGGNVSIEHVSGKINGHIGAGDVKLNQIEGNVRISTGTGDIDLTGSKGKFAGSTGTGDVALNEVEGDFAFSSGTGKVEARNTIVTGDSQFNSGTGNVFFGENGAVRANLALGSGTGNATIDLENLNFLGTLQLKCDKNGGRIEAPFSFDQEKEKRRGKHVEMLKTKKFGEADGLISVASGLGTAAAR